MTSCVDRVPEAIDAVAPELKGVLSVHVFGSALHEAEPKDLDLLVVYDPVQIPPRRAAGRLRPIMAHACAAAALPPADVVLLTGSEADATDFAHREHARLVYGRPVP